MGLFDVTNKTILITGASRGIGRSMAEEFSKAGAIVYGTGSKPESIEWMKEAGLEGRVADIKEKGSMSPIIEEIKTKHGKLNCLINNAGIAVNIPASAFKEEDIYRIIDTNFVGMFRTCQAYYKSHKLIGGNIINISSILGLVGYSLSSVYSGTKGAAIQLTKSLAAEWVNNQFRLNAICPGFIDTDMNKMIKDKPQVFESVSKGIPMKRMGRPEDIAGAAIFLASEASSYMTGQVITIDGGLTTIL
jgi:3-oxoacyl-[acyl-carrier protein] reductase